MNRTQARAILEASLSRPSSTPNTSQLPRDEFIEIQKDELRKHLVEPIEVTARPGDWAIKHCGLGDRDYPMIAIARDNDMWLLLDPDSGFFYKAFALEGDSTKIFLLGFYSDDALAEWRG
jgi:hypothetical protein